jgi:hypothetical protein
MRSPFIREPAPFVTRWRSRTVANGDSIALEVRRVEPATSAWENGWRRERRAFSAHSSRGTTFRCRRDADCGSEYE